MRRLLATLKSSSSSQSIAHDPTSIKKMQSAAGPNKAKPTSTYYTVPGHIATCSATLPAAAGWIDAHASIKRDLTRDRSIHGFRSTPSVLDSRDAMCMN